MHGHNNDCSTLLLDRYFIQPSSLFLYDGVTRNFDDLTYSEYWRLFQLTCYDQDRDTHPNYFVECGSIPSQPSMHVILQAHIY